MRLDIVKEKEASKARVLIVQPNIPQREKIDPSLWGRNVRKAIDLSSSQLSNNLQSVELKNAPIFVVWPENAAALIDESPDALQAIDAALPSNAVLIAGAVRREFQRDVTRFYNSISIIARREDRRVVVDQYDKHHLVPFGEYLPLKGILNAVWPRSTRSL